MPATMRENGFVWSKGATMRKGDWGLGPRPCSSMHSTADLRCSPRTIALVSRPDGTAGCAGVAGPVAPMIVDRFFRIECPNRFPTNDLRIPPPRLRWCRMGSFGHRCATARVRNQTSAITTNGAHEPHECCNPILPANCQRAPTRNAPRSVREPGPLSFIIVGNGPLPHKNRRKMAKAA